MQTSALKRREVRKVAAEQLSEGVPGGEGNPESLAMRAVVSPSTGRKTPTELWAEVEAGRPSLEACSWLARHFRAHRESEGELSLDRLLALDITGRPARMRRRDEYLRAAFALCDGATSWTRARQLAAEIAHVDASYIVVRGTTLRPDLVKSELSDLRRNIVDAIGMACGCPKKPRQLFSIALQNSDLAIAMAPEQDTNR